LQWDLKKEERERIYVCERILCILVCACVCVWVSACVWAWEWVYV
jgi:hypothetical protein